MRLRRTAAAAALAIVTASLGVAPVGAAPSNQDIAQVEAQVSDLQGQAEAAAQAWNRSRDQLAASQARLAALHSRAAGAAASYQSVARNLGSLVSTMYRTGSIDLDVQALFSDNPSQFLQEMTALQQVGSTQLTELKRIRASRLSLQQAQSAVRAEQAVANKYIAQAAQNKREAYARLAKATALLNSLKASQRASLLARQRAQVAASARSAALAASSLRAATAPISARALRVVQYALSKVGDRYVWGGSGPIAFDCTGLTMMSYRQIGISLAHDGYTQRRETRNVPRNQVRPGDLVFFFGHGLGHVGMYIGNGRFVHAAKPGTGVIVSSLSEPYYAARLSGFGRVIG